MNRLPPILFRDYLRHVVWPHVQLFGAAFLLLGVLFGMFG